MKSAFPADAIERVQVLEYGDDTEVEPGETAVRAFIARAGRPEGEEADKETVTAFEESNHSVLMKLRDELPRFIGWIEFLPDRPSGAPRPHSLPVLKIAGRGVRARTPEEVSEELTPVMTRLGPADLATVDTLITAGIDITNAHGAHLVATVSAQAITGTVTLKDGRSAPFTARLISAPGSDYGLFRSEETFNGVRYLGGWIIPPPQLASARAGTGTEASLASVMVPMPVCCNPDTDGGILDEQTGALITSPPFDGCSVTVPDLGTFRLTPCREAQC